jgi:hypothetical protein
MFEIGKKYKIQDLEGIYYTALIIDETEYAIFFTDLNKQRIGLSKREIKKWKQIEDSTEEMEE